MFRCWAVDVLGGGLRDVATRNDQSRGLTLFGGPEGVRGISEITLVQEPGQPSLTVNIDRAKIARYGLNVSDINGLIEAAVGGAAATQVVQGEKQFDLVVRLEQQFRDRPEAIGNILVATADGSQIPLTEFADIRIQNGRYLCISLFETENNPQNKIEDSC